MASDQLRKPKKIKAKVFLNRRSEERFVLSLPVSLDVLIPEQTFTPRRLTGKTNDLSAGGMFLTVDDMPQELYREMIGDPRYVRIAFTDTLNSTEVKVTGKVIGLDTQVRPGEGSASCNLRVSFPKKAGPAIRPYLEFVKHIEPS